MPYLKSSFPLTSRRNPMAFAGLLAAGLLLSGQASAQSKSAPTAPAGQQQAADNKDTPGLFAARYTQVVAEVLVNNVDVNQTAKLQIRKSDGVMVANGKDIRRWGKQVGSKLTPRAKDNRWYSLKQFPKLKHYYEPVWQRLYIGSAYETATRAADSRNDDGTAQVNKAVVVASSERQQTTEQPDGPTATTPSLSPGKPVYTELFRGGNLPSANARSKALAEQSEEKVARDNCEFLTDGVLNANKVNYQSLLLNVHINGVNLKTAHQFIRRPCGPLLAPILEMRDWRIKVAGSPNVLIDDIHWLNLEEFEGIEYEVNMANQEIFLTVAAEKFASIELDFEPLNQPAVRSGFGGFLNYGVNASRTSTASSTGFNGVFELGLFAPLGTITSDWSATRFNGNTEVTRLNTTFVKDFPMQVERLSVGDVIGKPGAWGIGYRLAGVQFGSNFGTQPGYQVSPVEQLRILADEPVLLRVVNEQVGPFVDPDNNRATYYNTQQPLPYGPLEVYNLPTFANGIYTAQGIASDGSVVSQSQRYFFNQGLLKQGLHSYSVELGAVRQGGFTDKYDTLVFSATDRYGFNRYFTGEARVEYGDDVVAYGLSLDAVIPYAGVLTTTLAQGHPTDGSFGSRGFQAISLNNRYRRLSYNLNFRHFDRRFIHPGEAKDKENTLRHNYAAGVSGRLPWNDSLSLGYNATSSRTARFSDSLSVGYTINSFSIASATFLFRQELHQDDDWLAVASLSMNLESIARLFGSGSNRQRDRRRLFTPQGTNLSITANQDSDNPLRSRFRLNTNSNRDLNNYGVAFSAPLIGQGAYTLSGSYSNRYFNTNASVSDLDDVQTYTAGISGGIAFMGGGAYFTRPLTNSFGLVDLGEDAANVRVNGVRTNKRGRALVPNLLAYFDNRISVNLDDLPLSAQLEEITTTVRPHFRSGVYIQKEIPYVTDMLVRILLEGQNEPVSLPYSAQVTLDENSEEFPVGDDGYVYITGVTENSVIQVNYRNQRCTIEVPLPEDLESDEIPEPDPFVCAGVKP